MFFNNLVKHHIESSVSQLSLFSLGSTFVALDSISNLFGHQVDTKQDTKPSKRNNKSKSTRFGVCVPSDRDKKSESWLGRNCSRTSFQVLL